MGIESLGKKLSQLGADTKNSVQKMSESYQISSKVKEQKAAMEKLFAQIGEKVFNADPEAAPAGLEEIYASVKEVKDTLSSLEDQRQKVKRVVVCPECGKEAPEDANFCSVCGTKLPERKEEEPQTEADEAAAAAETLKEDVKDVAGEAGDLLNQAADKARGLFSEVAEKADSFFKGMASKLAETKEKAAEEVQDAVDEAEKAAEEAAETVQECCGCAEQAEQAAQEAAEECCECAEQAAQEAAEECCECAEQAAEEAAETVEEAVEAEEPKAEA